MEGEEGHVDVLNRERAYLRFGVKTKNVCSGLVTLKGRHKPDSDGLSSLPITVCLSMLTSFPRWLTGS